MVFLSQPQQPEAMRPWKGACSVSEMPMLNPVRPVNTEPHAAISSETYLLRFFTMYAVPLDTVLDMVAACLKSQ